MGKNNSARYFNLANFQQVVLILRFRPLKNLDLILFCHSHLLGILRWALQRICSYVFHLQSPRIRRTTRPRISMLPRCTVQHATMRRGCGPTGKENSGSTKANTALPTKISYFPMMTIPKLTSATPVIQIKIWNVIYPVTNGATNTAVSTSFRRQVLPLTRKGPV